MPASDDMCVAALVQCYYDASCTPQERAYVEGNADLLAQVATMRRSDAALQRLFSDAARAPSSADNRPSPQILIAYLDGLITEARRRFVEQCTERFPETQAEIRLLQRLGSNPLRLE
jgi:anti-sigma factor RsiW